MKLVIAEKPSVGAAIAAVLGANEKRSGYFEGGGYLVSWCIGHLISLADAATYNEQYRKWKYDDLPIVPQKWQFVIASVSALSMNRRIAKSPFPAFGLAAWKQVQSARAFQTSKTGAAMITSINPRFAEQRPIGSLALTRPAFFLSSITKR